MKLLLCNGCSDVRALRIGTWTRCRCRQSRARYKDTLLAEVSGDAAILLGMRNDSLEVALQREIADRQGQVKRALGHEFTAFIIPWSSPHALTRKSGRRRAR